MSRSEEFKEKLDDVDATVFVGDLLYEDSECLEELSDHCHRWLRQIEVIRNQNEEEGE